MKLTDPQKKMLIEAAADEDFYTVSVGLHDGPKRTARRLVELGLGRYFFWGCGQFQANRVGRDVAAELVLNSTTTYTKVVD